MFPGLPDGELLAQGVRDLDGLKAAVVRKPARSGGPRANDHGVRADESFVTILERDLWVTLWADVPLISATRLTGWPPPFR